MWKATIWSYKFRSVCQPLASAQISMQPKFPLWPFSLLFWSPPPRDSAGAHCLPSAASKNKEQAHHCVQEQWNHTGLCISTPNTLLSVQVLRTPYPTEKAWGCSLPLPGAIHKTSKAKQPQETRCNFSFQTFPINVQLPTATADASWDSLQPFSSELAPPYRHLSSLRSPPASRGLQ